MGADRTPLPLIGRFGLGLARVTAVFALLGGFVILCVGLLDDPISWQNLLVAGGCAAFVTATRDSSRGRVLSILFLFTSAAHAAVSSTAVVGAVAIKEQGFAWLCSSLGTSLLAGHALKWLSQRDA